VGKTEGSRGRGGAARGKGERLTLHCLCRVVGLGQLGSRHVVGNGRFRGHSMCTLYRRVRPIQRSSQVNWNEHNVVTVDNESRSCGGPETPGSRARAFDIPI